MHIPTRRLSRHCSRHAITAWEAQSVVLNSIFNLVTLGTALLLVKIANLVLLVRTEVLDAKEPDGSQDQKEATHPRFLHDLDTLNHSVLDD